MIGYRPPSTKVVPPVPPEFAQQFREGGWRRVERIYGARTDLLVKWAAMCGAVSSMPRPSVLAATRTD